MRALILGGGETGRFLASALSAETDVVLVDQDASALAEAEESLDVLTLAGNVTHRRVLERAEAKRADIAIAVTGHDAVNVAAAVMARECGVTRTICRVDSPTFYRSEEGVERGIAGIDACICASRLVGQELLRLVSAKDVIFSESFGGGHVHCALFEVTHSSDLCGESPVRLRARGEAAIGGVLRGGVFRAAVEVETLVEGDRILAVASPIAAASVIQRGPGRDLRRVVLIGGGDAGLQLANLYATLVEDVRLVDPSRSRCEELASLAPTVSVLHGDGTNLAFLREEQIGLADAMIAVTGSDEINLMASLLARELGVERTFALVHRPGYTSIYEHLGVSGTTSAHEVMTQTLQVFLPGREILRARAFPGTDLELLELRVPMLDRPVSPRSLPLGPNALVVGVITHTDVDHLEGSHTLVQGGEHLLVVGQVRRRREILRALSKAKGETVT